MAAALWAITLGGRAAPAQRRSVSGYYQNVGVGVAASAGAPAGALDAERVRLMWTPKLGPLSFDAAYENTLWWRDARSTGAGSGVLSSARPGGDWLTLGWTGYDGAHVSWRQRFDRLSVSYSTGSVTATLGRQTVSWATTLFLTPADPFVPFDPSDPFRDYRTGVDAARVQWFAGPFSMLDFVARPADTPAGRTVTALLRGKTARAGWEMSAWGGAIHDAPGAALGVTRTIAGSAVRSEMELRRDTSNRLIARAAIGVDRRFSLVDRDFYAVLEYQHDSFGAARASDLGASARSAAARRNELQVLGRDEAAIELTYQVHPLVSAELLALRNLGDGSALISPAASFSLSDELTIRAGVFLSSGRGVGPVGPRSEYGVVPVSSYVALSTFF